MYLTKPDYKVGRVKKHVWFIIGNWTQSGAPRARDIIIAKSCSELPNIPHNLRARRREGRERGDVTLYVVLWFIVLGIIYLLTC